MKNWIELPAERITHVCPGEFYKMGKEIWYFVEKKNDWFCFRKCELNSLHSECIVKKEEVFRTEEYLWYLKRANEIDNFVEIIFEEEVIKNGC